MCEKSSEQKVEGVQRRTRNPSSLKHDKGRGVLKRVTVTTVEWTKLRIIVALQSHFSNDMFSYL